MAGVRSAWKLVALVVFLIVIGWILLAWGLRMMFSVALLASHLLPGGERGFGWGALAAGAGFLLIITGVLLPYLGPKSSRSRSGEQP
jgi:uncharacterized membrane protein